MLKSKLNFEKYSEKIPALKNKLKNKFNLNDKISLNNSINSTISLSLNNSRVSTPRPTIVPTKSIGAYQTISPKNYKSKSESKVSESLVLSSAENKLINSICEKDTHGIKKAKPRFDFSDKIKTPPPSQADLLILNSEKLMAFSREDIDLKSDIFDNNLKISSSISGVKTKTHDFYPEQELLKTISANVIEHIPSWDGTNSYQNIDKEHIKIKELQTKNSISTENLIKLKRAEKELLEAMNIKSYTRPNIEPPSIKEKIINHLKEKNKINENVSPKKNNT